MTANEWATVGDEICCLPRQHYTFSRLLPVSQGRTNQWINSLFHRLEEPLLFEAEHPEDEGAKRVMTLKLHSPAIAMHKMLNDWRTRSKWAMEAN